jgi:DNA-binding transcriptional MerR regulator
MADETLLTLKQVAEELGLPQSTLRYYRNAYSDYVAAVGAGRRRRYPPQAVAVLRHIAQSYSAGKSRAAILLSLDGTAATFAARRTGGEPSMEEVSNLDLLAAIVDGEREQREALWQMAREIVRLTEVLEGQERLLVEVAEHAGVDVAHVIGEGAARAALHAGPPAQDAAAMPAPSAHVSAPAPSMDTTPPAQPAPEESIVSRGAMQAGLEEVAGPLAEPPIASPYGPTEASTATPLAEAAPGSEIERLKQQLETERQLVERLRDAKLKIEQRAADAEAELEERRASRGSIIRRLLGPETDR